MHTSDSFKTCSDPTCKDAAERLARQGRQLRVAWRIYYGLVLACGIAFVAWLVLL